MSRLSSDLGRRARALACAVSLPLALALSGCATQHPHDPLESWNRGVFSFNDAVDVYALKPMAEGYVKVTPSPVRTGVRNFFGNIGDVWSSVNLFLQGRFKEGAASTMRVAVNSTLGLGGLIDLATPMRLERFDEDLGQTLGVWGAPSGAYIVWPILGPSSVRDSANIATSMTFSATTLVDGAREDNLIRLLNGVSTRAAYLKATDLLDGVALDKYAFTRDAYLQRRQSLIDAGRPQSEFDEEEEAPQPRYDLPETEEEAEEAAEAAAAASAASAASAP
jgi:phospholipid-binding lipoprotein MlaA